MEKKRPKPYYQAISTTFDGESEFGPSMVEPCNNLSLEQIVKDFSRGIVHPSMPAMYDDGVDIPEEMNEISDFTDLHEANPRTPAPDSKAKPKEDGKSEPPASSVTKEDEEG